MEFIGDFQSIDQGNSSPASIESVSETVSSGLIDQGNSSPVSIEFVSEVAWLFQLSPGTIPLLGDKPVSLPCPMSETVSFGLDEMDIIQVNSEESSSTVQIEPVDPILERILKEEIKLQSSIAKCIDEGIVPALEARQYTNSALKVCKQCTVLVRNATRDIRERGSCVPSYSSICHSIIKHLARLRHEFIAITSSYQCWKIAQSTIVGLPVPKRFIIRAERSDDPAITASDVSVAAMVHKTIERI